MKECEHEWESKGTLLLVCDRRVPDGRYQRDQCRRCRMVRLTSLELEPRADPAGPSAGGPQAHGQRPEDAPLELGPDHQRRG